MKNFAYYRHNIDGFVGKDQVVEVDLKQLKDMPMGPDYESDGIDKSRNALGTLTALMYGSKFQGKVAGIGKGDKRDFSRYNWNADLYNFSSHLRATIGALEVARIEKMELDGDLEKARSEMLKLAYKRGMIKLKEEDFALADELGITESSINELPAHLRR